jgi:hypothetical protein
MKGRVQVKVSFPNVRCAFVVRLEDGRHVRVPGWLKRGGFQPSWEQVAPEDVEPAKAALARGDVVSFG